MNEYNILRMCRHSIAFVLYCIHDKYKYNMLFMYTQNACNYTLCFACMYFSYILLRLPGEVISQSAMHVPMYCVVWWTEHTVQ